MDHIMMPVGEKAIIVTIGKEISKENHQKVMRLMHALQNNSLTGVTECVPAYCSITIHYDPIVIWKKQRRSVDEPISSYQYLKQELQHLLTHLEENSYIEQQATGRTVEIPVCYGGKLGPDLVEVAKYHEITPEEVVAIHTGRSYLVHMIGFVPGFPYLGGMDKRIAMPRKAIPRQAIPAGSVGIAGEQTGIYPLSTPGGWRIIGRTPLQLFRPEDETPTLIRAGDFIKFIPITSEQFEEIQNLQWT